MQKIIQSLPVIVIVAALSVIIYHVIEERQVTKKPEPAVAVAEKVAAENLPVSANLPEADRQTVSRVFNTPEQLDAALTVPTPVSAEKLSVAHPALLSEAKSVEVAKTPVSTDWNPAFQKDFESLRTEAIRNPDSEQNRDTVKTLMQKRQQRLAQKGL